MTAINGIERVYVTIGTVETNLSEGDPLEIVNIDNLGASEATRITERGPSQDGDSDTDQQLEPRIIPIVLQARVSELYSQRYIRDVINDTFKGTNIPIALTIVWEDGRIFQIDTKSVGNINLPLNIGTNNYIKVGVVLRAANPTFYDPEALLFNFGLAGAGQTLVPVTVPTFVGGSSLDQTTTIEYDGTYRSYPVIYIYGPITNPKIVNDTTANKIDFTGITIANGDYYTIDLRFGRKAVYKNGNPADNRINEVTLDSTLATFAIEAKPVAVDGDNTIHVTGSGITGVSQVLMQLYRRFDGQ
jgi:hypothetical protein